MSFSASLQEIVAKNENGLLGTHPTWQRVRLGEVCTILNGFAFKSAGFTKNDGLPLIRIRDVLSESTRTRFKGNYDDRYLVHPGELVVGMDGDFNAALWAGSVALLNQRVCKVSPDETFYSRRLLAYVIQGYLSAINAHTSAITVKHLSSKTVAEIPLPLPPRGEQERIADALDGHFTRLDAAEETLTRIHANLKRYRASVLHAAVEGRLVPTEVELARHEGRDYEPASILLERILQERRRRWEEVELAKMRAKGREPKGDKWKAKYKEPEEPATSELPDLPDGWAWSTVDALAEVQGGLAKGKKRRPADRMREVPYLRVANVQRGHLDLTEVKEIAATEDEIQRLTLRPGDVLFNEGGDRDKLGRGWIWRGELRECIHQNHVFRARLLTADVLPEFLSWYGNSIGQAYFLAQGKQTTNLASISLSKLRSLPVPIPPFAEQRRIAEQVEDLLSAEAAVAQSVGESLTRCARLREAILRWAFEGKLVDQDPGDEPPSVALDRVRETREMPRGRADQVQLAEGASA